MLSSIRTKQLMITAAITLLTAFLFSRDIKGLVKPKTEPTKVTAREQVETAPTTLAINLAEISKSAKTKLNIDASSEISGLEAKYADASVQVEQLTLAKTLAKKWNSLEQPIPSAMYLEIVAEKEQTLESWLATGDRFLSAFDAVRDSTLLPTLLEKANFAYKNAIAIDSASNEAKTGLGITIVNGLGMPMQGISMLMEVVKKDPNNLKANLSLGTFAIKSGQFDKAIARFKRVIEIKPSPEAYFYLGTAYENLGNNEEAIDTYLKSKKLASNPTLSKFVDGKVLELKSKN